MFGSREALALVSAPWTHWQALGSTPAPPGSVRPLPHPQNVCSRELPTLLAATRETHAERRPQRPLQRPSLPLNSHVRSVAFWMRTTAAAFGLGMCI